MNNEARILSVDQALPLYFPEPDNLAQIEDMKFVRVRDAIFVPAPEFNDLFHPQISDKLPPKYQAELATASKIIDRVKIIRAFAVKKKINFNHLNLSEQDIVSLTQFDAGFIQILRVGITQAILYIMSRSVDLGLPIPELAAETRTNTLNILNGIVKENSNLAERLTVQASKFIE